MVKLTRELMEDLANRLQCPECGSHFVVKDGKQWDKQTIRLFVHSNSINSITKVLKIPFPNVQKWIKKAGQRAEKSFE